jgi:magnesium transporter
MSGPAPGEESVRSVVPVVDLAEVDAALHHGEAGLRDVLKKFRPADIGRDLSRRNAEEGRLLATALDDRRAAQMLRAAHPIAAANVLEALDAERATSVVAFLPMDHRVAILAGMDAAARARVESAMDPPERNAVERLLALGPSSVGRLMTPRYWSVKKSATVGDAMGALRSEAARIEVAQNLYVVDDAGVLVGVAALRDLAVLDANTPVRDVMVSRPIAVPETCERGDAAEIVRTHEFLSLPVVDARGALVGVVRVDDLLDAMLDKAGTGVLNQGAVAGAVAGAQPYFMTPLWKVVRSRITWLVLLFVAETATGTVLRHFEDELQRVVALSFFIPLLIGTGGNAGSQTVSTVIRALALGEVRMSDTLRVLAKEVSAGLILGVLLGVVAFVRAQLWGVTLDIAGCVAVTILVVCVWANTVGALIPIGAQRLKVDPTVVSGPMITTLVDASGLFLYLTIAHVMVAQLRGH